MLADKPFVSQAPESRQALRAAGKLRGLSDRTIAWLFILPTILLLLAINIFPLVWALRLSFTNFKSNMPSMPVRFVGIDNYVDILTDEDIWYAMQVTARFVFWSVGLEVLLGFGLALLINKRFRGHSFWTTLILLPMMLSPAVVGNFWTFLLQPQTGLFNVQASLETPVPAAGMVQASLQRALASCGLGVQSGAVKIFSLETPDAINWSRLAR